MVVIFELFIGISRGCPQVELLECSKIVINLYFILQVFLTYFYSCILVMDYCLIFWLSIFFSLVHHSVKPEIIWEWIFSIVVEEFKIESIVPYNQYTWNLTINKIFCYQLYCWITSYGINSVVFRLNYIYFIWTVYSK